MTNHPAIAIREMRPSDVEAVAALIREFAQYMRRLGDETGLKLDAEALRRDGFGPRPAFEGFVADSNEDVAGFLLLHDGYDTDQAARVVFIVDLYVRQQDRGRGIGAALWAEAERAAKARGATQLVWTVDKHNAEAVSFYRRQGARMADGLHLMYKEP